jgi:hypothetical protein
VLPVAALLLIVKLSARIILLSKNRHYY